MTSHVPADVTPRDHAAAGVTVAHPASALTVAVAVIWSANILPGTSAGVDDWLSGIVAGGHGGAFADCQYLVSTG